MVDSFHLGLQQTRHEARRPRPFVISELIVLSVFVLELWKLATLILMHLRRSVVQTFLLLAFLVEKTRHLVWMLVLEDSEEMMILPSD